MSTSESRDTNSNASSGAAEGTGAGEDRHGDASSGGRSDHVESASPAELGEVPACGPGSPGVPTDEELRRRLTPLEYEVIRNKATERAFSGKYWNHRGDGTYVCIGCGAPLFDSETKFESGTGWPSFWAPIEEDKVALEEDRSHFMVRTEVLCQSCGAHLGHVFEDGPMPTGMRYCINSAALDFVEEEDGATGGSDPAAAPDGSEGTVRPEDDGHKEPGSARSK